MSFALTTAEEITQALDAIIAEVCPTAGRRPMYGGIVFEKEPGKHSTMVCGHFVYKGHVSLEFSRGAELDDPDGVLEGKGKYRRHIKFTDPDHIGAKSAEEMLRRAFSLPDQGA